LRDAYCENEFAKQTQFIIFTADIAQDGISGE